MYSNQAKSRQAPLVCVLPSIPTNPCSRLDPSSPGRPTLTHPMTHHPTHTTPHTPHTGPYLHQRTMATMDKQKENLERVTDFVEERQLDADRMAQVGGWMDG